MLSNIESITISSNPTAVTFIPSSIPSNQSQNTQNQRITESFRLRKISIIKVQPLTEHHLNQIIAPSVTSSHFLNTSKDGSHSITSLGSSFQFLTTFSVNKFFLTFRLPSTACSCFFLLYCWLPGRRDQPPSWLHSGS